MSKEVEEKEVAKKEDKKKKGNGLIVTILVVVLLAVFFGLGYGFGGTKVVEKVVTGNSEKNVDNTNSSNAFREIDADSLITNLWKRVNFSGMYDLSNQKEINYDGQKVSEMSDKLKGIIASKYYYDTADYQGNDYIVKEKDARYAYDSIFGAGTYKDGQAIFGVCGGKLNFTYDANSHQYTAPAPACGGISLVGFEEAIVKVEKNSSKLVITSAIAFLNSETSSVYKTYDNATNQKDAITEANAVTWDNLANYVKTNKDTLNQYKFTFDVDSNGFYKYVGYEKVA